MDAYRLQFRDGKDVIDMRTKPKNRHKSARQQADKPTELMIISQFDKSSA